MLTYLASPHQTDLFDMVAAQSGTDIDVIYLHGVEHVRRWTTDSPRHNAICLDREPERFVEANKRLMAADVAVLNYYAEEPAQTLLQERASSGKPWCYWGERPGFRKPEWIGRIMRKRKLSSLHGSRAPIWGVGRFAVDAYKSEFGSQRNYSNVPYFTDLGRFVAAAPALKPPGAERVFLFAGSLIRRKGVDLLAGAFAQLAAEFPGVRLKIIGEGELRGALGRQLAPAGNRVEFLGFKDWKELPEHYPDADILCAPSRYDGWGMVVPEGLACGLPVVATDQMGAAHEFIEPGRNGWMTKAGDGAALYEALREAAVAPVGTLAEMSQRARESVSNHTVANGAARFCAAARDVAENWRR